MPPKDHGWTVICDFDGTISTVDVTDCLLEAHADPEWLDIEAEWKSGDIGSCECLSRQLAVLRATADDIEALADTIDIDADFKGFADFCARHAIPLVIVSDGLDSVITRILTRHGIGHIPVYANSFITTGANQHRLVSPHRNADCCSKAGTCKCEVVSELTADGTDRILFVGDGQSDFCAAARVADVVAAKSKLLAHLNATGKACEAFTTFADVQKTLAKLVAERGLQLETQFEMLHEHN
jgi:2-hydroxy-3-keto-5-methylthiopentenyl-1-phosphate phosphatase